MKVVLQNEIYDMVMQELESVINREKRAGRFDMGIKGKSMLSFIQLIELIQFKCIFHSRLWHRRSRNNPRIYLRSQTCHRNSQGLLVMS